MRVDLNKMHESIKDSNITIEKHPLVDLSIYGYYKHPLSKMKSAWNEYSKMCRGLILNKEGQVIERAFDKFWTFRNHITEDMILLSENKVAKIPDSSPRIFEKLDGTMGVLYWIDDVPFIATQRSFSSLKARKGSEIIQKKYYQEAHKLNREYSYIFEVIYPETSLVVDYGDMEDLVLIGVIDKKTGKSVNDISVFGFKVKKELTDYFGKFSSLNEIEDADISNLEGVVLEYDNGLRIKVKFPWYKEVHKELQKILNADFQIAEAVNNLKRHYNYKRNNLHSGMIEDAVKNGEDGIATFLEKLNIEQVDRGAIQWVQRHKTAFQDNKAVIQEFFCDSVEFRNTPDDRIWNWRERYLDKYYD